MKSIITKRDSLTKEIGKYWAIISNENIVDKNVIRNYNLKKLYELITTLSIDRIGAKMDLFCINMGLTDNKDLPTNHFQTLVFLLSEKSELWTKLGTIRTLPKFTKPKETKSKDTKSKGNKKKFLKTEELTSAWIKEKQNELLLEMNAIRKKLEELNENASFTRSVPYNLDYTKYGTTKLSIAA